MERFKKTTIIFLLAVGFLTSAAPAKTVSVLLQEGLYAEEIQGDLDAAIKIYEQVISESKETQRAAAEATYRIGMCYLKKGRKDKAAEHFQNVILNFPIQKALVTKAEKQLDKIKPRAERIVEQAVMTISTCAEGDPRVTKALESLKGLDESAVVNELVKFLDSETGTVRRSAIYVLWKGDLKDVSAAVPALEKLCSHKEETTRGMAAITLGASKAESSFDALCDMTLKDTSGYARRCAAYALGLMGRVDARPTLEKATKDSDHLVQNNAKAALAMLPEKVRPPTRVFEPQALDELIKSGKVPSFEVQLPDNTGLDLDSGEIAMLKDEWPDRFDVAWDNDGGGVLMKKTGSGVRFLALPSGEKQMWDEAVYIARSQFDELRNSNTKVIWASQSKFAAVLTSEGNLAVIQIGEYDANKGTIYGWIEKIPAAGFGPVVERVVHQTESKKDCMIDFESGRLFAFPENLKDLPMDDREVQSWLEKNGIDAIAAVKGKLGGLEGVRSLRAVSMRDLGWDALPEKLVATTEREIALHPTPDKARMFAFGGIPFDFFFKTGDGGMGVLQLLEVHSPHIGTRIRYKMLQPVAVKETVNLNVGKPAYEWWRSEPSVTHTIYEDSQLEIVWDVEPEVGRKTRSLSVGVLPMERDISDFEGHLWFVQNLAFTVRRTPYGKQWKGTGFTMDPKNLTIGEYRIYVCAFDSQQYQSLGWSQMLKFHSVGAATAKLIVRPKPSTQTAKPRRDESARKLKQLGLAVAMFANEHNSKLPDSLHELEHYVGKKQDFQWILENVEYLGKGKKHVAGSFNVATAYDKTLLEEGNGTNVLFADGHVKFETHRKLEELCITPKTAEATLDLNTPEATIKSFVKAVYVGNLEAAKACVSKDGHDYDEFMEMLATESNHPFQAMIKAMDASIPVEITSKNITEDRCKIKWYFTLGRVYYIGDGETKWQKGKHTEFSSYLELVGDKWLIRDI